jgi:hypothetical protein
LSINVLLLENCSMLQLLRPPYGKHSRCTACEWRAFTHLHQCMHRCSGPASLSHMSQ